MKQVSIEIIQKCPNNCIYCSSNSNLDCSVFLPKERVFSTIDGFNELDIKILCLSGGEPFLHSDIVDIVMYAKRKGLQVVIYTSGIYWTERDKYSCLPENLIKQVKEAGVDKLIFNLQALEEEKYNQIMGTKDNLQNVIKSIKKSKEHGIYTEIHFVPMKINIDQIDQIVKFKQEYDVDKISFLALIPHGRAALNREKIYLSTNEVKRLKRKLASYYNDEGVRVGIPLQLIESCYECHAGIEKMYIKFDGCVYGCEAFKYIDIKNEKGNVVTPDSILHKDFLNIVQASEHLKLEKEFIQQEQINNKSDEKCPIQRKLRELERGEL